MNKTFICFLVVFCCTVLPLSACAFGTRPSDVWNFYHFDGTAFSPGPPSDGGAFIAVRHSLRPVVLTALTSSPEQTALPAGSGAIAGICYQHSSGGKLGGGSTVAPYPHVPVLVSSGGTQRVTVQTDDHGYFVVVLPEGTYSVAYGPSKTAVTVERGTTTLIPLRGGKRMVD
ncbi:MAG: hypothetical protein PHI31_07340 [Desulfuromonadaceae bacterium]|nr:hypothetical protein [Desulfuromonadaceae bacterium]